MAYTPDNPYIPGDPYSYDLKWIVDKLKEAISLYEPLNNKFNDLKAYVMNYFNNLDLDDEIRTVIGDMQASGYFDDLIYEIAITDGNLQTFVTNWLADNVNPVGSAVVVDKTLSITGAAADAARVGLLMDFIDKRFGVNMEYPTADMLSGTIDDYGNITANQSRAYSDIIDISQDVTIYPALNFKIVIFSYDANHDFVGRITGQVDSYSATAGQHLRVMVVKQDGLFVLESGIAIGSRFTFYMEPTNGITPAAPNYVSFGANYSGADTTLYDTTTPSVIYGLYDNLMANYPDNMSKTLLGMDESGTFPIYMYEITPPPAVVVNAVNASIISTDSAAPKVALLTSGTHGNGPGGDNNDGILALYHAMEYMLSSDDFIESQLANNTIFKIVPCVNPWGIANNSRYNSRNVDINRNFQYGWTAGAHSGSNYYSEAESRYIRDLMAENPNIHIEVHTRGGSTLAESGNPLLTLTIINSPMQNTLKRAGGITKIYANIIGYNPNINVDSRGLGQMDGTSYEIYSIPSCLIECAFWIDAKHSANTDKTNTIQIGNAVYYMLKDL